MNQAVKNLRKKQRDTLEQIFRTSPPSGLKWSAVESLIGALCGKIKEGSGSRVRFLLNGSIARFHRPHPSPDTDKGAVVSLREWLESTGVKP
ncbi:type II toxin-antitoxin system HicA family toxin [Erwinia tracheiphila]|uniref:Type II toxin-antitoxin system HicA family toxin n=1 Tax=Erwinia tracheiphila TaxID=65700 RepID=A0A345CVK6_9GAMM|nr:type II toxin-antitoxin system HicA family toxin [Erwinia tracheiphila]AXF77473.1 type II toxin-antitoxin system HicA family toxin [Erwinia tracheiphila]UIA83832.1 type II toxin-antitoxin system HicA family toxin [Erwinia tracheiphila]UIA92414.1 type II toxin-antitoxin system HicA family toxin [Erwinia tracheiphila]